LVVAATVANIAAASGTMDAAVTNANNLNDTKPTILPSSPSMLLIQFSPI
jgi:hypothetical protein